MNTVENNETKIKSKDKNKNTKTKNINPPKNKVIQYNCTCHTTVWCEECYGDFDLFEDLYK